MPPEAKPYLLRLVNGQIEQRQREYAIRNDFMQSLIQIRNAGNPTADKQIQELASFDSEDVEATTAMSVEQCAAHVFLFYLAGFDTSASMAVYTVFETARHPRVLRLLCREIDETLHRHGNQLTYECIGEMKYLELCMKGGWVGGCWWRNDGPWCRARIRLLIQIGFRRDGAQISGAAAAQPDLHQRVHGARHRTNDSRWHAHCHFAARFRP